MYRYVIFDMDGTILNTLTDLADACNWVCQQHGWPGHPVEAYKHFVGNGARKLLERIVPYDLQLTPELRDQLTEEFSRRYIKHGTDKTAPYPGLPELLANLKQAGVTMAVLTNKPDIAAGPMVELYYPGVFHAVQGALPDLPTKPDPTLLFRLMEKLGAAREETLFVGDSNVDIQTAKNGGLTGCGVLWGFREPEELVGEGDDYLAETPQQLEELILA